MTDTVYLFISPARKKFKEMFTALTCSFIWTENDLVKQRLELIKLIMYLPKQTKQTLTQKIIPKIRFKFKKVLRVK